MAIAVACLGDSVTAGFWQPPDELWPHYLQQILGDKYAVAPYAQAGKCASRKGDQPYWETEVYAAARDSGSSVYVLMLGSNDSKEFNWTTDDAYVTDLSDLVKEVAALPGRQRMLVCSPPPAHIPPEGAFNMRADVIPRLPPLVKQAAEDNGVEYTDVNAAFLEHSRGAADFADGVHPNAYGQALIARTVGAAILRDASVHELLIPDLIAGPGAGGVDAAAAAAEKDKAEAPPAAAPPGGGVESDFCEQVMAPLKQCLRVA